MRRNNTYTKVIIIVSFVISAGLIFFISLNANNHLSNMSRNNTELYSAYRISEFLKAFKGNLLTLEEHQNAYLASGDPKFLEEFNLKEKEINSYLKSMEKYFLGKPEEEKFYSLKNLTYKKMEAKNPEKQNNVAVPGRKMIISGSNSLKEINEIIEDIENSLSRTTQTLIDKSVDYVEAFKKWSILEAILGVIVLLAALMVLLRDISIRNTLEKELRIAKKQADDNAMMKEQFMANMSHEIRTPMNAILGFTDLMQKTSLDKKQAEYTTAIRTSGSNLLNIINDILDFSKIEAGKLVIEKIAFNIPGLIGSLKIMFSEKARQKNIGFEVEMSPKIPEMVFGDPTRLTQILVNLINNAIKFTDHGHVKLSCEVKNIEEDIVRLVFRVKDTGIGIPTDKLDTIFERFNQGNREMTRIYGGTGLGLSIVRDLVALQKGELEVKSSQGEGSEFIATIGYPVSYETHTKTIENFKPELTPISSEKKLTVLLAEDNELNQKLATTFLKGFGLNVEVAENGQIAVDKLRDKKFDIVLMDIQMPLLDGYHAAQKIRQELQLGIPIVAMTAHIMSGEREKCISYGMNDYISKPFRESDLYAMVTRYLKQGITAEIKQEVKPVRIPVESTGVVDFNDIDEMARGNKAFIVEMIELFLEKNPQDISEIEEAIAINQYDKIRAVSHRMKTSVGFMGLKYLGEVLAEIEAKAENKENMTDIVVLLGKVKSDCIQAGKEFREALQNQYA